MALRIGSAETPSITLACWMTSTPWAAATSGTNIETRFLTAVLPKSVQVLDPNGTHGSEDSSRLPAVGIERKHKTRPLSRFYCSSPPAKQKEQSEARNWGA